MDNLELFNEVLNRGLWIESPGDIVPLGCKGPGTLFVVSDIDGKPIAKANDRATAVLKAYGTVCRDLVRSKT